MQQREFAQETQGAAALANLYEEYYDKLARYIAAKTGNRDEAEDLAGEVFLRALKSIDSFQWKGVPLHAWLFKIAHNLVVDYWRKRGRHREVELEEAAPLPSSENPAEEAIRNLELAEIRRAMQHLTQAQQEVIQLRFLAGLPSAEVAAIMGKKDGAVRELQHAALKALRQMLASSPSQTPQENG
ncbi:MAG: sigma-70 family RNA polymerase sigma factor [Dehalococcoidia bacterium]